MFISSHIYDISDHFEYLGMPLQSNQRTSKSHKGLQFLTLSEANFGSPTNSSKTPLDQRCKMVGAMVYNFEHLENSKRLRKKFATCMVLSAKHTFAFLCCSHSSAIEFHSVYLCLWCLPLFTVFTVVTVHTFFYGKHRKQR